MILELNARQRDTLARKVIRRLTALQAAMSADNTKRVRMLLPSWEGNNASLRFSGGLCLLSRESFADMDDHREAYRMFKDALAELFGTGCDPFGKMGKSFSKMDLDWPWRAERLGEIIALIKEKHVRSHKKVLAS